jgi:hypothetical protein
MSTSIEFDVPMEAVEGYPQNGMIAFPYDLKATFGKKSVKVKMTFDGVPYRGLLKSMGGDCIACLIRKDIRQKIGKNPGDIVHVTIEEDARERVVEVPGDLQRLLDAHPAQKTFFDNLSFTGKKEYTTWITYAKRNETRAARLEKALELLKAGKRKPY